MDYCTTLNSGTSALHATLLAYGLAKNDEIIVPSFSFISTVNSVLFVDATPVFSDIEEETFGLDPNQIEDKISSNTKAVIPVDYGGLSCKINEVCEIAKNKDLIVIEDSAEALGSTINGKKTGSVSDSAIFSFCGNKVLTTGEGGAVVTNSKTINEKIKSLRSHGRVDKINYFENTQEAKYEHLGYNWRMSSITAAMGISQLNKLDKIVKMRQENAIFISSKLSKHSEIRVPNPPSGHEHIYQMYTIQLESKKIRDELHNYLSEKGIFSKVYFSPIHLTPFYKAKFNQKENSLPNTEKISQQVLTLPIYPNMTLEEKNYLVETVSEFFESVVET